MIKIRNQLYLCEISRTPTFSMIVFDPSLSSLTNWYEDILSGSISFIYLSPSFSRVVFDPILSSLIKWYEGI